MLAALAGGSDVALVSDAGTPCISDPGFRLVRAVVEAGHVVSPVPGPCAALAALSVSGLPTDRFVFEGFLPRKSGGRRSRLEELASEPRTLLLQVTPHHVERSLAELVEVFGPERRACLARELTKLHEELIRGTLAELHAVAKQRTLKGEMVLVIAGAAGR